VPDRSPYCANAAQSWSEAAELPPLPATLLPPHPASARLRPSAALITAVRDGLRRIDPDFGAGIAPSASMGTERAVAHSLEIRAMEAFTHAHGQRRRGNDAVTPTLCSQVLTVRVGSSPGDHLHGRLQALYPCHSDRPARSCRWKVKQHGCCCL